MKPKLTDKQREALEAAVAKGFITFKGEVPIDDGYDCGDLIASVVSAVAPFCQKPEVPKTLRQRE